MMPQMDSGGQQNAYGRYEGTQSYQQQPYDGPQRENPTPNMYDDAFVDAFAQRLSQRMAQGPQGKLYTGPQPTRREKASPGQRLALAIVSVVMLVPLSGIAIGLIGVSHLWVVGLMALGAICLTIIIINGIFNSMQ
jgi:hypothetical protein